MAQRKIKLTMSGELLDDIGPIIDIDFDGESLETDFEINAVHGSATVIKEYTVDKAAGEYILDFTFKNDDMGPEDIVDRNFVIDKIEIANNGTDYLLFEPTEIMKTVTNEDGSTSEVGTLTFEEFDVTMIHPQWENNRVYPFKQWVNGTGSVKITFE